MNAKFKIIENAFFEYLRQESDKINKDFVGIISNIYIYPPEKQQDLIESYIGIDVVFLNVVEDNSDNLSLQINIIERQNLSINVRTSWGHPSGILVQRMFNKPIKVNDSSLRLIHEKLPEMVEKLRQEIRDNPFGK